MHEKSFFSVDSQGNAELHQAHSEQPRRAFEHGMVLGANGKMYTDPTSPDAIANAKYFVDTGGRIIDTQSGEEVTPGEGSLSVKLEDIKNYENRDDR